MRVLVITQIFPNAAEPLSAPFNQRQLAELGQLCQVDVMATLPWFPGAALARRWSAAARRGAVPRRERIGGLEVEHPRAVYVPRVGRSLSAGLYAASLWRAVARRRGQVDVVLGTWAYPDGCAAVVLARSLGVPAVVKLHGSDLNVIGKMAGPRIQLRALLPRAARVVAVSQPLAEEAAGLGVARERIRLVKNGVDGARFQVRDRGAARAALGEELAGGAEGPLLLYVGHLKVAKGVLDLVHGFARVAARRGDVRLAVVGGGEAGAQVAGAVRDAGLEGQVILAGPRPHDEVATWMAAADALVLPSWNEGTPNVVLEALASGRRVVATRVGGIPDLVTGPLLGELVPARDPAALADALERAALETYDPAAVAAAAAPPSWPESAAALCAVLEEARAGA